MGGWRIVDIWDDDDPALTHMRDLLALRPPEGAPEQPADPEPAIEDPLDEVAKLTARLRAGDLSVRERLARLLHR